MSVGEREGTVGLHDVHVVEGDKVAYIFHILSLCQGEGDGLCGRTCAEGDLVGVGLVGLCYFGQVVVGAVLAYDAAVEHLVGLEVDAEVVELDGSGSVAHVDVAILGVEHLGVVKFQLCLCAAAEGLEGCDVVAYGDSWVGGSGASCKRLCDIHLESSLVRYEDAFQVVGVIFVPVAQPYLEAVVNHDGVVAHISVVVGVVALLFGHHLYTLDADEVAVVLLVLGLCHGEDDWCGCAVGGGNGVGVGVVALDQLGDVVVGGTLADDRTVEHLSCREFQAGVVEVDGSAGVAHVNVAGAGV